MIKLKFFELDSIKKQDFRKQNPLNNQSVCSICDFSLLAEAENGWFNFIVTCEHLFLKNIYSYDELKQMSIDNEENYKEILYRLIDFCPSFENALRESDLSDEVRDFMLEDLNNTYETLQDLRNEINHITVPDKRFDPRKKLFSEKLVAFLYSSMIDFCKTSKVKGIPLSQKLIENIKAIMSNTTCIHHSHVMGEKIGYINRLQRQK